MSLLSKVTLFLLLFTGLNAIIAGMLFMLEPGGSLMGMSTHYLDHSPFKSYFIPGLVLFVFIGLFCFCTAYLSFKKRKKYSKFLSIQGLLLAGWILIQVFMVRDFNWMHLLMLSIGVFFITSGVTQLSRARKQA